MNFATFDLNFCCARLMPLGTEDLQSGRETAEGSPSRGFQSALSRLRHALDDPLFVRHGNRLVRGFIATGLTGPCCGQELEDRSDCYRTARFDLRPASGTFRITASGLFAELLIATVWPTLLHQEAPGIRAQLVDLFAQAMFASLERRKRLTFALIPE